MSQYTFCDDSISDLYKDAYGFRPGVGFMERWDSATDAERQAEWDWLVAVVEREIEAETALKQASVAKFEDLVAETITTGARDRETALRWIMDASNCQGDWDFLAYDLGLPHGYFRKAA